MSETIGQQALQRMTLRGSKNPLGIFIASIDPSTTEIAADAGFDFVMIDSEHGPQDRLTVLGHVRAAEARGIVPLVRTLGSSDDTIQAMLDVGAKGLVLPKISTRADAVRVVAASRYAPVGKRGMCPACHDGRYSLTDFTDRMARRNDEVLVIPIIETIEGVDNIEEIVSVDGIDVVHFGPGDLSAEMGLDLATDRAKLEHAWQKVRDTAHAAGKTVLVPAGRGFEGGDALGVSMELVILNNTLRKMVTEIRGQDRAA